MSGRSTSLTRPFTVVFTVMAMFVSVLAVASPASAAETPSERQLREIRQGLLGFVQSLEGLATRPELATPLPATSLSVSDALGLDGQLRANLRDAMTANGDSLANLPGAIDAANGFSNAVVTDIGSGFTAVSLDIDLSVTGVTMPMAFDDGALRFLGGAVSGGLSASLLGSFTFIHDPSDVFPERRFKQTNEPQLTIEAWTGPTPPTIVSGACTSCTVTVPAFPGLDGFVDTTIDGAYAASVTTTVTMRDPNGRGELTTEDHLYIDPADLFRTDSSTAGDGVAMSLSQAVKPVPGQTWTILPGTGHGTVGLVDDPGNPFDAVDVQRGVDLARLADLTYAEGLTGLAKLASIMSGAEAAADVDLPFVDASVDSLLTVADDLTELIAQQAHAGIVCGRANTIPPSGLPRVGEPAYCQATTTEAVTSVTGWSVFGAGSIVGTPPAAAVGLAPSTNITITGFSGFPQLEVSYDGTTATGSAVSRTAISPIVSAQGLSARLAERGLGGQPQYDPSDSNLRFDIDRIVAADPTASFPLGSFEAIGPPTGLTDLTSRPGVAGPNDMTVALGQRSTSVDFGFALDVLRPIDPATNEPTLPDRFFLGVGSGAEVSIASISASTPAAPILFDGRIGFLGVDVDVTNFTLATDAGQDAVALDFVPTGGATFTRPDTTSYSIADAIAFSDLLIDASGSPFATPPAGPLTPSFVASSNMSTSAAATVRPQQLNGVDLITLDGLVPTGTFTVDWQDLDPRTVPSVVTGGDYDEMRLLDLVPTVSGFVDGPATPSSTTLTSAAHDFLRDLDAVAGDEFDRTIYNIDKGTLCRGFTVVDANTITCETPLEDDDEAAVTWDVGDAFTIPGDDTAMRRQVLLGLQSTLRSLDSLGTEEHKATLPLVDVRPDELAVERDAMNDELIALATGFDTTPRFGGTIDNGSGDATTLVDTVDELAGNEPVNFEFDYAIDPLLPPGSPGRQVEGILLLVDLDGVEVGRCEGFVVVDPTRLACDTPLASGNTWDDGDAYRVILERLPQRETVQGFVPSLLALLAANAEIDAPTLALDFEIESPGGGSPGSLVTRVQAGHTHQMQVPLRIPRFDTALVSKPVTDPANNPVPLQVASSTVIETGVALTGGAIDVLGDTATTSTASVDTVPATTSDAFFGAAEAVVKASTATEPAVAKLDVTVVADADAASTPIENFDAAAVTTTRTGPATPNDCGGGLVNDVCASLWLLPADLGKLTYSATASDSSGGSGGVNPLLTRPLDWPFLAQGLTSVRSALVDELDGEVFGVYAPLVGASLDGGLRLAEDNELLERYTDDAITNLASVTDADSLATLEANVRAAFEGADVPGSFTANVLQFSYACAQGATPMPAPSTSCSGLPAKTAADVFDARVLLELSGSAPKADLPFDTGMPGLALSSPDDVEAEVTNWTLRIVVGVSRADGPYVMAGGADSVFTIDVDANFKTAGQCDQPTPDANLLIATSFTPGGSRCIDGLVGFLPASLHDEAASPSTLDLTTTVQLHAYANPVGSVVKLGFGDLTGGKLVGTTTMAGSGRVSFLFETTAEDLNMDFPDFGGTFLTTWTADATNPTGKFSDPAYAKLHMDTGAFGKFVNGAVKDVKAWLDPYQPVLAAIQKTIPVLSDFSEIAGNGKVTMLSLMSDLKIIPPGSSNLLMRLIELQSFSAQSNNLWLPLGENGANVAEPGFFTVSESYVLGKREKEYGKKKQPESGSLKEKPAATAAPDTAQKKGSKYNPGTKKRKASAKTTASVSYSPGGISFPILEDTTLAYDLLTGDDVVLVRFDFGTLTAAKGYSATFPVAGIGPITLDLTIGGSVSFSGTWAMGYSTRGIRRQISRGGDIDYAAALIEGVYIDDYGSDGKERDEFKLVFAVTVGASVTIGFLSGGVTGTVSFTIGLDLNDPNGDGRIYFDEFEIMGKRFECMFTVTGRLGFVVAAFFKLDFKFYSKTWTKKLYEWPPSSNPDAGIIFQSAKCPIASPRLAKNGPSDTLILNMGSAGRRQDRNLLEEQRDERFTLRQLTETPGACDDPAGGSWPTGKHRIQVEAFEVTQVWCVSPGGSIVADGADGKDVIRLDPAHKLDALERVVPIDFTIPSTLSGGSGPDRIQGGDAADVLNGGTGNDTLEGGRGDDTLTGNEHDDILLGQIGNDLLVGSDGNDKMSGGPGADILRGGNGDDGLTGGLGANPLTLFAITPAALAAAASGDDSLASAEIGELFDGGDLLVGGFDGDNVEGGYGEDIVVGGELFGARTGCQGTSTDCSTMTVTVKAADPAVPSNIVTVDVTVDVVRPPTPAEHAAECRSGTYEPSPVGVTTLDLVDGGPDNDHVYGGNGDDNLRGGPGADNICGLNGDDLVLGDDDAAGGGGPGGGADEIRGGVGRDQLFGGDEADHIYGDENDDYIDGGPGADVVSGGRGADLILGGDDADTLRGEGPNPAQHVAPSSTVVAASGGTAASGGSSDTVTGDFSSGSVQNVIACASSVLVLDGGLDLNDDLLVTGADDGQVAGYQVRSGEIVIGRDSSTTVDGIVLGGYGVTAGRVDINGDGVADAADDGMVELPVMASEHADGDCVLGGDGADRLEGGLGGDHLDGEDGDDLVLGDVGRDFLRGSLGDDELRGGPDADLLIGDSGEDLLVGEQGVDRLRGMGDDDRLIGGGAAGLVDQGENLPSVITLLDGTRVVEFVFVDGDELFGGGGNDVLAGDNAEMRDLVGAETSAVPGTFVQLFDTGAAGTTGSADKLFGGFGDDWGFGQDGDDEVRGGPDEDVLEGGPGADTIRGDDHADLIVGGSSTTGVVSPSRSGAGMPDGGDIIFGDAGVDGIDGSDVIAGDNARLDDGVGLRARWKRLRPTVAVVLFDVPAAAAPDPTTSGPDVIDGGGEDDLIFAQSGDDAVLGGQGDDAIEGGPGRDTVNGNAGADEILGGSWTVGTYDRNTAAGGDLLNGGSGLDAIIGDNGRIEPHPANPALTLVAPHSYTMGGSDVIDGDENDDVLIGGAMGDRIIGDAGDDFLLGDHGTVVLDGATVRNASSNNPTDGAADTMFGDEGNDIAFGGAGSDVMSGGPDHDIMFGDQASFSDLYPVDQPVLSTFSTDPAAGAADVMFGDDGDDFLVGQQSADTIYGGPGENDITGGHNVIGGLDDGDLLVGGDEADAILGDNGTITRTKTGAQSWLMYPLPFDDVIRTIVRFDDIDGIGGNDTILSYGGDDQVFGQRGDDGIDGGEGADELIGQLGADTISGGGGPDVILGDVGIIERAMVDGTTPRINANGAWHRDVFLEEVGSLTETVDTDTTPLRSGQAGLAERLIESDVVLFTGAFDGSGDKVLNADNQAWDTDALLVDLFPADGDTLAGDAGEDLIFGQRGDDTINGGADDDFLVGDSAVNVVPFDTDLPQMVRGLRIIGSGAPAGVTIDPLGAVVVPHVQIGTDELGSAAPGASVLSDVAESFRSIATDDALTRTSDGASLVSFLQVTPDIVHNIDAHSGNDSVSGDSGNDVIFGDDLAAAAPVVTGIKDLEDALEDDTAAIYELLHGFRFLGVDLDLWQHELGSGHTDDLPEVVIGSDDLRGGSGSDTVTGDDGIVLVPWASGLPIGDDEFEEAVLAFHTLLRDIEHVAADASFLVEVAHGDILDDLIADAVVSNPKKKSVKTKDKVDPDDHDVFIGIDTIDGGSDGDTIVGGNGAYLLPYITGEKFSNKGEDLNDVDKNTLKDAENALKDQQKVRKEALEDHLDDDHLDFKDQHPDKKDVKIIPFHFGYDEFVDNDDIEAGAGDDVVIGDAGTQSIAVVLTGPSTAKEAKDFDKDVERMNKDLEKFLKDLVNLHDHAKKGHDLFAKHHGHDHHRVPDKKGPITVTAFNDVIGGGDGSDLLIADNGAFAMAFAADSNAQVDLDKGKFDLKLKFGGNDVVDAGSGDDVVYGQYGVDVVDGGDGDDSIFGGKDKDVLDGGSGDNEIKKGGGDKLSSDDLDRLGDVAFANIGELIKRLLRDVAATAGDLDAEGEFTIVMP